MLAGIQLGKNMSGGAPKLERGLSRDWLDIGHATDTIGAEKFSIVAHSLH